MPWPSVPVSDRETASLLVAVVVADPVRLLPVSPPPVVCVSVTVTVEVVPCGLLVFVVVVETSLPPLVIV